MTRVICVAPLIDSARLFMQSELGWEIEERDELGSDADAAVAIVEAAPLGQPQLDALPALRLIVSVRGEPVNVDLAAATARGIPVVHAPGRNAEAVAEFTIGVMIALLRRIVSTHELVRRRVLTEDRPERVRPRGDVIWRPADSTATVPYRAFKGPGLRSTTLGLLGLGAIGASVAGLANALGMRVIGHDPYLAGDVPGVQLVSFDELLGESDVVSLHARGSGARLIGAAELSRMRPGALLINTARATILDYDALVGALRSGRLAGAALDVYPDEPLTPDDPLLDLDNVILTPHIAGASLDVARRQWEILEAGLRALLLDCRAGDAPIRNPESLPSFDTLGATR
jgi:D-3-phosphoglycerate dehydrogenase